MKKSKIILLILITFSIVFSFVPKVTPQIGTYTFHGAAGNEKTLVVRTADNASLEIVFGPGYAGVIEGSFGTGALVVGAKSKSLVLGVNFTYKVYGLYDGAQYNTSNWDWTTGAFSATPDSIGDTVASFYDPTLLTGFINLFWTMNVTVQNAAAHFAQLPTPVAQYLGAIVWEPKWQNVGNTVVHTADAGDFAFFLLGFQYLHDCVETWTYDSTYGSWIGYKLVANSTTIYEFSIELPATPAVPGFELSVLLAVSFGLITVLIYVVMKKRK
jgi:hypothetical protein